jgi:DnaJ-class molecular chaperone
MVDYLGDGICPLCRSAYEKRQERNYKRENGPSEAPGTNGLREAYQFLGCSPSDSDATIKKKFRELAKQCHPDQLQELPPHKVAEANHLFRDLRDAYELIMASRKA